eukprot:4133178-Prymnesium_polylepis.1
MGSGATLPVLGEWRSLEPLVADIESGRAFGNATRWPLFVKACHLTQGGWRRRDARLRRVAGVHSRLGH